MQTSDNKAQYADATQKAGRVRFMCAEIAENLQLRALDMVGFGKGILLNK